MFTSECCSVEGGIWWRRYSACSRHSQNVGPVLLVFGAVDLTYVLPVCFYVAVGSNKKNTNTIDRSRLLLHIMLRTSTSLVDGSLVGPPTIGGDRWEESVVLFVHTVFCSCGVGLIWNIDTAAVILEYQVWLVYVWRREPVIGIIVARLRKEGWNRRRGYVAVKNDSQASKLRHDSPPTEPT